VLTADTYTSVLPDVARSAAEKVAALIIKAGCLVPGTSRRRRQSRRAQRRRRGRPLSGRIDLTAATEQAGTFSYDLLRAAARGEFTYTRPALHDRWPDPDRDRSAPATSAWTGCTSPANGTSIWS